LKALRREGRRGVSPVIATLLLIVIAVAAAVLVYMWTVGYATQMRPTTPETGERLKIEAGVLKSSGTPVCQLYVRNVGGSKVTVSRVYALTTAEEVEAYADLTSGNTIDPGDTGTITVNSWNSGSVSAGQTYIVRIVTSLGNEFSILLKAK
jgi:flagellin-like protein